MYGRETEEKGDAIPYTSGVVMSEQGISGISGNKFERMITNCGKSGN